MVKEKIPKILVYSSILILAIYLFISITRDYAGHVFFSEYKNSLKKKKQDTGRQDWLLKTSLRYSPSNAETFYRLGKLYADEKPIGKYGEDRIKLHTLSQEYFQEALIRKPTDGKNRAVYAWYRGNSGNTREAIRLFNSAIDLGPTDAYSHMLYAMWCMNQVKGEIDITNTVQFLEQYRHEKERDKTLKSYDGQYINGVSISAFLSTGQMEWDKALSLGTRMDRAAYESLADLKLLSFELDRAIEYYKRADNKLKLTRCYIIKDDPGKAVDILVSIINKGGTPFRRNLAEIKKLLLVVANSDSEDYRSYYWSGKIHMRLGKTEEALGNFKFAVHLNPGHIDAHLNLAELYKQTGKIDLAIKAYETILEKDPGHKEATRLLSEAVVAQYQGSDSATKP